jgi:hypothetical protein
MGFPPLLVSRCPCGAVRDEAAVKRGRNNRARGNAFEREVAHKLGVSRVGQYGGPEDVGNAGEWIMVQTKVGNSTYPTRIDALLRRIPFRANQLRAVVHGDAPGSAGKRRALITLDLDEFCAWFGGRGDSVELG